MMHDIFSRFLSAFFKHYLASSIIAVIIFLLSLYGASQLKINSNQIDMLPADLPQVKEAHKITDMIGGAGFFIITMKFAEEYEADRMLRQAAIYKLDSDDENANRLLKEAEPILKRDYEKNKKRILKLKKFGDDIHGDLSKFKDIRHIRHKFDLEFLKNHSLYRLKTEDLNEVFRRIRIKRDELITKSDPFYIELEEQPEYKLDLSDIIRKYSRVGKKEVLDNYYVSPDRRMLVMLIKPGFSGENIEYSSNFLKRVRAVVEKHNPESKGIDVGYTGSYVKAIDAYQTIEDSLRPSTILSLIGITLILLFFIRRKRLILAMLISLIYGGVVTFGITYLIVGELNFITTMLGGILAGLGIDFGIHFVFRFREEFLKTDDLEVALKESIIQTGSAAFWSASTTTAAFMGLVFSDFKGFSDFGLISAIGILTMAISMFLITPLQIYILSRNRPERLDYLKEKQSMVKKETIRIQRQNLHLLSRVILAGSLLLFIPSTYFGSRFGFDYDLRNMFAQGIKSFELSAEMDIRYEMTGDPMALATHTLSESGAVNDYFAALDPEKKEYIAQATSIFEFIPPYDQQLKNYEVIKKFKKESSVIKKSMLPEEHRKFWKQFQDLINAKPYTYHDIPEDIVSSFTSVPDSKYKGWVTSIYPDIEKVYNSTDLKELNNILSYIEFPLISDRNIQFLASQFPKWKRGKKIKISGSHQKQSYNSLELSEYQINGILEMVNRITPAELEKFKFYPAVNRIIMEGRPFKSLADLQVEKGSGITTGTGLLSGRMLELIEHESRFILIGTTTVVCLIIFLTFRRLDFSLTSLLTLLFGLIYTTAIMGFLDLKLTIFNVSVLPIIIGYGINNGIFIVRRFMESKRLGLEVFHTASAVMASSLTTLAGWAPLVISDHPGLRSMGHLATIGLGIMMVVAVIILPAILQFIYQPGVRKSSGVKK